MRYHKSFILIFLTISVLSNIHATDENLFETLEALKAKSLFINKMHPNLPTEEDLSRLEESLFKGNGELPISLKQFHQTIGNLSFFGIDFPTAHSTDEEPSHWHDFIREGKEENIPPTWLPFALSGTDKVCMELGTGKVCLFYFDPEVTQDDVAYANLGEWIKAFLLNDK